MKPSIESGSGAAPAPTPAPAAAAATAGDDRSPRLRKWLAGVLAFVVLVAVGWRLLAPGPLTAELAQLSEGPLAQTVDNQGQVRLHDKYSLAAPVAAQLRRIELHEGDPVKKDEIVVTLSPLPMDTRQREEAQSQLAAAQALAREAALRAQRAQADWQFAQSERARVDRLAADKFVSPQALVRAANAEQVARAEWDAARSREQAAIAQAKTAEAALVAAGASRTRGPQPLQLRSPVDGFVVKLHERSERTVAAGTPLITIGDPKDYELVVDVLSTDAVKIRPGNLMLIEGWGGPQSLRATVSRVEPVAFTKVSALGVEEQRVNVIGVPLEALGPLGDGYRIEARIVIWSAQRVQKLPASSVFRVGERWHVFALENGRARERSVEIGHRNQDEVEILGGLAPGSTVIRFPDKEVKEGRRVVAPPR